MSTQLILACALTAAAVPIFTSANDINSFNTARLMEHSRHKSFYLVPTGFYDNDHLLNTLQFKLPYDFLHAELFASTLHIRVTPDSFVTSEIDVTDLKSYHKTMKKKLLNRKLDADGEDWYSVSMRNALYKQKRHFTRHGMTLRNTTLFLHLQVHCKSADHAKMQEKSYIELVTMKSVTRRRRSHLIECRPNQKTCCLHSMEIDFTKDVGIRNILSPRTGVIHYCQGRCEKKLIKTNRDSAFERLSEDSSCCVATEYDSLHLLYLKRNQIISRNIQTFSARKCECR